MFVLERKLFGGKSSKKIAETKTKAEMRILIRNNPKLAQNTHVITVTKNGPTARTNNVRAFARLKEFSHGV